MSSAYEGRRDVRPMIQKTLIATLGAVALAGAASAQVGAFKYSATPTDAQQNATAGRIAKMESNYDPSKGELSWSADFTSTSGTLPNAFWLVVSDGPDPKGIAGQLAIFYFDASTMVPKLTAYGYNGENGFNSYRDGSPAAGIQAPDRIASSITTPGFATSMTVKNANGVRTLGFSADISGVNAYKPTNGVASNWEGAKYGSKIGVWFHPVSGATTSYDDAGYLSTFNVGKSGWYDANHQNATPVPEPASLAILGLGLVGVARRRRAKKA